MVKGIKYIGNIVRGISVVLYASYNKITLLPQESYLFTKDDNTSDDAINSYRSLRPMDIVLVSDDEVEPTPEVVTPDVVDEVVTDETTYELVDGTIDSEDKVTTEDVPAVTDEVVEPTDEVVTELSDNELFELLENKLGESGIKELIATVDPEYKIGRKSVTTLVEYLLENHKDKVVEAVR